MSRGAKLQGLSNPFFSCVKKTSLYYNYTEYFTTVIGERLYLFIFSLRLHNLINTIGAVVSVFSYSMGSFDGLLCFYRRCKTRFINNNDRDYFVNIKILYIQHTHTHLYHINIILYVCVYSNAII